MHPAKIIISCTMTPLRQVARSKIGVSDGSSYKYPMKMANIKRSLGRYLLIETNKPKSTTTAQAADPFIEEQSSIVIFKSRVMPFQVEILIGVLASRNRGEKSSTFP
jgi:hypothetical protein